MSGKIPPFPPRDALARFSEVLCRRRGKSFPSYFFLSRRRSPVFAFAKPRLKNGLHKLPAAAEKYSANPAPFGEKNGRRRISARRPNHAALAEKLRKGSQRLLLAAANAAASAPNARANPAGSGMANISALASPFHSSDHAPERISPPAP